MGQIKKIEAREILDSRANPTIETTVTFTDGCIGTAAVPSGASTGVYEAVELRDQEKNRYGGKGVRKAVENVNKTIADALTGDKNYTQEELDEALIALDGTKNKEKLGANAILSVSLAFAKAEAQKKGVPLYQSLCEENAENCQKTVLPIPMMNVLNGGVHAANNLDFQEFMIIPMPCCCKENSSCDKLVFAEALRMGVEVYHALASVLKEKGFSTAVGDEGGFAPEISDAFEALDLLMEGVKRAGYVPGKDFFFAMDAAASELHQADSGMYYFPGESKAKEQLLVSGHKCCCQEKKVEEKPNGTAYQPDTIQAQIRRSTEEMMEYYAELIEKYPLISIEDPLDEEDYEGFAKITEQLSGKIQLVGDDLFVTNPERLQMGIDKKLCNAILIKPNQIGTLTETIRAINMAKAAGYKAIVSHRSGETEDTTIADLAVAMKTGQIKTGAPCRSERVAKYNRLLKIELMEKEHAVYGTESGCVSCGKSE